MYNFLLGIQYLGIIMLALEIVYIVRQRITKLQTTLLVLMYSILINLIGYTLEMKATDVSHAMLGVKVGYMGKPFIIYTMYLFVMEYCGIKLKVWAKNILFFIQCSISVLVFTSEKHTLFYSSQEFVQTGVFPHLELGHGPLYNIYILVLAFYLISMFVVIAKKLVGSKSSLIKNQLLVLMLMVLVSAFSLISFFLRIIDGYDTTLLAYLFCVSLFAVLVRKYRLFDTLTIAKEEAVNYLASGLMVVDTEDEIVYTNYKADKIIKHLGLSGLECVNYLKKLVNKSQYIFISEGEEDCCEEHPKYQKCVYKVSLRDIMHKGIYNGQMFLISEVSDSYYYTERLQRDVREKTKELVEIQREIISSFATMIEARDGITGLHIKNTSNYVSVLVNAMRKNDKYADIITEDYAKLIVNAAHLHDVGKISIPDAILQKNGKLTDEEFSIMKTHPQEGAEILRDTLSGLESDKYLDIAVDMALYHHEKFNGAGYPEGLVGEEIPLPARIMAVADVYDALRSKRHYKEGFSKEKSMSIIEESKGTHFDPDIADIFLEHIDEIEDVLE